MGRITSLDLLAYLDAAQDMVGIVEYHCFNSNISQTLAKKLYLPQFG